MSLELFGVCASRFSALREAFAQSFAVDEELGARFSLVVRGEVVVDLWAGHADPKRSRPFTDITLTPVFSVTKALAAIMIARLVEQGRLSYEQTVASLWPAFGQAGKAAITVGQAMSHQAGLPGFLEPMDPTLWFDQAAILHRLEVMAPMWPPGSASGYHPITAGFLSGEIFRRVDGRSLGHALRQDLAEPLGLDLWIGLPEREEARCAGLQRPKALANFDPVTDVRRAAFLTPWSSPGGRGGSAWRRAEFPAANGHATALALARLLGALADDGVLDGVEVLSPAGREAMARQRISGPDLVLPFDLSWGAGVMRNAPAMVYGPGLQTFGHSGWGGACAFADPETGAAGAYVMNRQSPHLIGDPRPLRLIEAAYLGL